MQASIEGHETRESQVYCQWAGAYWSPEQIIGHYGMNLSIPTIYRALKGGLLPIVPREKLRQQGKSRKPAEEEKRGASPSIISQPKQLPEVAQVTGKGIPLQANGEPGVS